MNLRGFAVTYRAPKTPQPAKPAAPVDLAALGIEVVSGDSVEQHVVGDRVFLVDGYVIGVPTADFLRALMQEDDTFLSGLHGHYCAVSVDASGKIRGYCDRFGARTLFWQVHETLGVIIRSRWEEMPVFELRWADAGLSEMLRYRWTSGRQSILAGISQLPLWHRVEFHRSGDISLLPTAQQPQWPTSISPLPFDVQLAATRSALQDTLGKVARHYDRAAIFLSGGIDSSLLAALCKPHFRKCLLVTPVFTGRDNPELAAAQAYAKTLGLEHQLVEIDDSLLERQLRELVRCKGGQVNFLLLTIQHMIEKIPDEYELVVYGEGADLLFGVGRIERAIAQLRRKRYARLIPKPVIQTLNAAGSEKLSRFCALQDKSVIDTVLQGFQISYDSSALSFIQSLCGSHLDEIYAHQAVRRHIEHFGYSGDPIALRGLLQDITLKTKSANHYREVELAALCRSKKIFNPFLDESLFSVAKTLTAEQYFGKKHLKPILRELAAEHFDRDLIFRKKQGGFFVPMKAWFEGPFAALVKQARAERTLFDGSVLARHELERHYGLYWSLISWMLANEQVRQTSAQEYGQSKSRDYR